MTLFAHLDPDDREEALATLRAMIARRRRRAVVGPRILRDEKRCPGCDTVKPIEAFGLNASSPDGRQVRCRPCRRYRPPA